MTLLPWSLSQLLTLTNSRRPFDTYGFIHYVLLPVCAIYASAVLTLLPGRTFPLRLGLLPVTLSLAFRSAIRLDLSFGHEHLTCLNQMHAITLFGMSARVVHWTLRTEPFRRVKTLTKGTSQPYSGFTTPPTPSYRQYFYDAFDLCTNSRGCGWNWSVGCPLPTETRSVSTTTFLVETYIFGFVLYLVADFLHYFIQSFGPSTIGSPSGHTIFDASLPPTIRYFKSSVITLLCGLNIYTSLEANHAFSTLIAVLVFGQHPSLWPLAFDRPFASTSLREFWGKGWHQSFRSVFISMGGYPLSLVAGRTGYVLGSFLVSGVLHDVGLRAMDKGGDSLYMYGFFLINGVGMVLEDLWRKVTGRRVGGRAGWLWTMMWLIGWGNLFADSWARKGCFGRGSFWRPSTRIFGPLQVPVA